MGNCLGDPGPSEQLLLSDEHGQEVALGHNQRLIREPVSWSADAPLTAGQLRGLRDTFWETAPSYEGRAEIWDALKAACEAVEGGDYDLAQAIVDGAEITLPRGRLTEAYDELGNRYVVPKYCINRPQDSDLQQSANMQNSSFSSASLSAEQRLSLTGPPSEIKIRLSTQQKDLKVNLYATDCVRDLKKSLAKGNDIDFRRIKMLYAGRVLSDSALVKDLKIPKNFVIQAIVT